MRDHLLGKRQAAFLPQQTPDPTDESWADNRGYGVVIDAGSSGSRVYIYSWKDHDHVKATVPPEKLKGMVPIVERGDPHGLKWTWREEPGISSYGSRPQEVGDDHLKPLLDFAAEVVPPESQSSTSVFLMATAGMRLLPEEERNAVLNATCNYIRDAYLFKLDNCDVQIRIIPGELEGIYGWVAVNYLMGGFDSSIQYQASTGEDSHHTFGFLDMGGASAQIAFEPEHHQREEHFDDLSRIYLHTLDGKRVEYDVFVTTFLGYGSNEARRRYLEERIRKAHDNNQGKNLLDEHRTLHLDDPCLPLNLNMTDSYSTSVPLLLHGTGSFAQCIRHTAPLLNKDADCPTKPCLFNGVHTPHIDWSVNKFVGISEYWYSSHDILGLGGVYDFTEYEKKATEYCAGDWNQLLEDHKDMDPTDIKHHQMQCFKSAWIVNVLHDGIEIPRIVDPAHKSAASDDQDMLEQSIESIEAKNWSPPFQSIDTIDDIQVSWTLGAMVLHVANQIPLTEGGSGYHNTDDEGAHRIADGVELPSPHTSSSNSSVKQVFFDTELSSPFDSTMVILSILGMFLVLWCFYRRRASSRKRHLMDGLLGGSGGGLPPYSFASSLATALSRSTLSLRSWAERRLWSRPSAALPSSPSNIEINTFSKQPSCTNIDGLAIDMGAVASSSGSNSPVQRPSPFNGSVFSAASQSISVTNMKMLTKKRYSGDSNASPHFLPQDGHLPLRNSSSAINLANRANSSSNNDL